MTKNYGTIKRLSQTYSHAGSRTQISLQTTWRRPFSVRERAPGLGSGRGIWTLDLWVMSHTTRISAVMDCLWPSRGSR